MGGKSSSLTLTEMEAPILVAAIDFGTTYSGYAYSFTDSPEEIILNKNWGSEMGISSNKTPTSVLLNSTSDFESFGYKAEKDYADNCSDGKADQFELYRYFKMDLYKKEELRRSIVSKSVRGKECHTMRLIKISLKYLKDNLLKALSKSQKEVDPKLIKWVLTVPAIWSESAKQFMREAAVQAGLIEEKYSERLVLALEPEAASVFCRELHAHEFISGLATNTEVKFADGTVYLLVDIGGGTIDVTAHKVESKYKLTELMSANGGDLGGIYVNQKFEELFTEIFGIKFVEHLKRNYPSQWLQLMTQYEYKKRDINMIDNDGIGIDISLFLKDEYQEVTGNDLEKALKESKEVGVEYLQDVIDLSPVKTHGLFDPIADKIIKFLRDILNNEVLHDLKYIILVGGFSDSAYLQQKIQKSFKNLCTIVTPPSANAVVLKGAVIYGTNPSTIVSRICRKTYGIGLSKRFVQGKHKESKKQKMPDGQLLACDVFHAFVRKDEPIQVDSCKSYPLNTDERTINMSIYCADKVDVIHTDDAGVKKLDELSPQKPLLKWLFSRSPKRSLETRMYFGKTEITVDIEDKETHQRVKTSIDFLKE